MSRDTGNGTRASRSAPRTLTDPTSVATPVRSVTVDTDGGTTRTSFSKYDLDISTSHSPSGTHRFEVGIWNLEQSTWRAIALGDRVHIRLGWTDTADDAPRSGATQTVLTGSVQSKRPVPYASGTKYVLQGRAAESDALAQNHSRTWHNAPPHRIVRDIAVLAGLDPGVMNTDQDPIDGHWAIKDDRALDYWLDQIANHATHQAGTQWRWFVYDGKLGFGPARQPAGGETVTLSHEDALIRLLPSAGHSTSTDPVGERSFTAYCQPLISKHRPVEATMPGDDGTFVVVGYGFESSTTSGRHHVNGTLVPTFANYEPLFPTSRRQRREAGQTGDQP